MVDRDRQPDSVIDSRRIRTDNFRKLEQKMYSIFVDNLGEEVTVQWLWEFFSYEGEVVDAYFSRKITPNTKNRFAFVRFSYKNHAERVICNLNGWRVFGTELKISWARYRRVDNNTLTMEARTKSHEKRPTFDRGINNGSQPKRTFRDILLNKNKCQESEDKMEHHDTIPLTSPAEVKAFVDNAMLEKLGRSIVGESTIPLNVEETTTRLFADWHTLEEVTTLGSFKMILSFDDEPNMLEALHSSFLLNHFSEIRRWSRWETNTTGKAWFEIIGIPPHAWNVDNVERIAAICGQVLEVDERATNRAISN
ncbi:hypothetical protein PIB30_032356 [Stylosanthes scabra]|uniref:RRM domain-containing protein n=1 Tax=Stylosanthes scabra TaxID=79078 RepID=A0ABU6TBT5_9FABA|nr:hypothetical protein [Stylosanthes scabra]